MLNLQESIIFNKDVVELKKKERKEKVNMNTDWRKTN